MSNLKKSTFKIGNGSENKLKCITESSDQYAYPLVSSNLTTQNQSKNNELKQYLKGHHFEFGLKTVKGSNPQLKTQYSPDNSKMKFEKENQENFKNDQRASHFKMGWEAQQNRPTSQNANGG